MSKFYALIVGVAKYQEEKFSNLDGAVRDARRLSSFFCERMTVDGGCRASEVNVVLLENPTSRQAREKFDEIVKRLEEDSVFVFYFAGHGLCLPGTEGPSLLCSDAMDALLDGAVGAGELTPQFIRSKSRTGTGDMLFVFDVSCDGPYTGRSGARQKRKGMKDLCRSVATRRGRARNSGRRCALSSCSDGEYATDDGSFVDAALAEWEASLEAGEGLAVGREHASRVSQRPAKNQSRQHPEIEGVSIALTPNGKKEGFNVVRGLRSAFALVVLAAILFFPKLTTQGRADNPATEDLTAPPQGALVADEPSSPEKVWGESPSRRAGTRQTLQVGAVEYGFCWIPAGEFDMGSPSSEEKRHSDERLHHVKLTKGFWFLETEVTQALYQEVTGSNPSRYKGENHPVERVSWDDAMKFCAELTKRLPEGVQASLPTEAQWEYACRAGAKTAYWYGNEADSTKMNYDYKLGHSSLVKSYAPNQWGLYDMHGNVFEWCLDYYGAYPTGTAVDPKGPNSGKSRVNRGGSWNLPADCSRSAVRFRGALGGQSSNLGFRVLLSCD